MTPEQYIQKLIELSEKKLDGLNEILNLTKRLSKIINEDYADKINRLIKLKQQQISLIDKLNNEYEVYYSKLKSLLGVQSIDEVAITQFKGITELKKNITAINDTIKQIQSLDTENKNKAEEIVDNLAGRIRRLKQHKMVNNGYNIAAKLPRPSYFFDKKK